VLQNLHKALNETTRGGEMKKSIRNQGTKKLIVGFVAGIIAAYFLYWIDKNGYRLNGFALITIAGPAAWGLVGLLEVIMNRPFSEMEDWWDSLKGWQRGIIGLFVVFIAIVLLFSSIAIAGILGII